MVILPAETWAEFKNLFAQAKLKKGQHFLETGKTEYKIGFVLTGIIRTFYCDASGKEYTKNFHSGNSFIGAYTSMIAHTINQIHIQALTDCELLTADYRDVENLFDKHPMIERVARKLSEFHALHKEKRELEMATLAADQRYRIFQEEFPGLENKIPQYLIASYLGITPTQLSRIRSQA